MKYIQHARPAGRKTGLAIVLSAATLLPAMSSMAQTASTATGLPDLKGKSFVFGGFGGDLQKNQDAAWLKPFAAATGARL